MVNSNMTTKEILNYAQPVTDLEKILFERLAAEYEYNIYYFEKPDHSDVDE